MLKCVLYLSSPPSPSSSSPEISIIIFFLIIILVVARRIYRNYTGVRVSPSRTIGYTVFYFAFGAFFLFASFFEGVPLYYAIPDAGF
jgi:glycerol uptake facilitator-like aquaporin